MVHHHPHHSQRAQAIYICPPSGIVGRGHKLGRTAGPEPRRHTGKALAYAGQHNRHRAGGLHRCARHTPRRRLHNRPQKAKPNHPAPLRRQPICQCPLYILQHHPTRRFYPAPCLGPCWPPHPAQYQPATDPTCRHGSHAKSPAPPHCRKRMDMPNPCPACIPVITAHAAPYRHPAGQLRGCVWLRWAHIRHA